VWRCTVLVTHSLESMGDHYSGFKTAGRVSGSGLHVVPRRLIFLFVEAYSRNPNPNTTRSTGCSRRRSCRSCRT